ncbi:zinc finger, RING/FYVE/PHD-type containing protein [Tanacetum coccineum]
MVKFRKFEIGRRNFALKKRSDAKKRLAGVVGWKNDLMKCRTDLLDRRASVLNLAKALEQRGGSLCRVDALRLRADALGRWADEYLRRAEACEGRAKALSQRARAYNQRVKAFEKDLNLILTTDKRGLQLSKIESKLKMDKVDHVSPLVELEVEEVIEDVGLDQKEEEEAIEDVGLDQEVEEDIEDLRFEIEEDIEEDLVQEEGEEEEKDDDEDRYKDFMLYPQVTSFKHDTGESVHGIQVTDLPLSTDHKRYEFDLCPICLKPWTLDKIHQMRYLSSTLFLPLLYLLFLNLRMLLVSCLPCGHMFGMSCLKKWIKDRPSDKCPHCYQNFSLESVRLLYAPRLCIPATADQKASIRWFSFCKIGFTTFKHYEWQLRTNALNKRSDVLKQRAVVLGRQNDAMKRRTELMNRMDDVEKRADVLERHNNAMKRQTQLLNRVTDEEDWAEASQQQADAEKRAEVFRRKAGALGQWADEYLRKADAFGQQAKALRQQAKSLRQLVDSYLASRKFYIQSYKEFLGLRDNKSYPNGWLWPWEPSSLFKLSYLKKWIKDRPSDKSVRLLYAPRLCIPATADQKASIRWFSFCKIGFTTFKHYEWQLRTNALNKRSDVLKQRAVVLGRQNDAMKRRTELMNRMDDVEKRADVLERHNNAMKWQTQLLNRMTDEEDWAEASQQQADAEKRAEVFRRKAGALGQCADEYLRKADAFGQQAKALRQQSKSLRQLVDSYLASRKFYIQSYKEFLGLRDNK